MSLHISETGELHDLFEDNTPVNLHDLSVPDAAAIHDAAKGFGAEVALELHLGPEVIRDAEAVHTRGGVAIMAACLLEGITQPDMDEVRKNMAGLTLGKLASDPETSGSVEPVLVQLELHPDRDVRDRVREIHSRYFTGPYGVAHARVASRN